MNLTGKLLKVLQDEIKKFNDPREEYFYNIKGNERSVVFRIAHAYANEIENNKEFQGIYIDLEPRRCNHKSKTNPMTNHPMTPDIIVHNRDEKGYIAVEFKCEANPTEEDKMKLQLLTAGKNIRKNLVGLDKWPHYELGLSIRIRNFTGIKRNLVEYIYYMNGFEVSEQEVFSSLESLKN